jgi:hypothetical protein
MIGISVNRQDILERKAEIAYGFTCTCIIERVSSLLVEA